LWSYHLFQLDPVGTINNLSKLLSSEEGLATVTEWLRANWYIPVSSVVGFVIALVSSNIYHSDYSYITYCQSLDIRSYINCIKMPNLFHFI